MDWGKIWYSIHEDDKFRDLSDAAQMLFVYLFSCGATSGTGVGWLPISYIAKDRNRSEPEITTALSELESAGMIRSEGGWIMVVQYVKHQPPCNFKHHMHLIKKADKILHREWRDEVLSRLSYDDGKLPYKSSDSLIDTVRDTVSLYRIQIPYTHTHGSKALTCSSLLNSPNIDRRINMQCSDARQDQINIEGVQAAPKKKAAKSRKKEPDFITRILQTCSEVRYNSPNSQVRGTTINPKDGKSRQIARQVHDHVVEQARVIGTKFKVPKLDTERELRYIGRLYERFLEHKNHNPDAPDFIVDANYPFIAFYKHMDEWIAAEGREEERRAHEKKHPPQPKGPPKYTDEAEAKAAMRELLSGIGDGGKAEDTNAGKEKKES